MASSGAAVGGSATSRQFVRLTPMRSSSRRPAPAHLKLNQPFTAVERQASSRRSWPTTRSRVIHGSASHASCTRSWHDDVRHGSVRLQDLGRVQRRGPRDAKLDRPRGMWRTSTDTGRSRSTEFWGLLAAPCRHDRRGVLGDRARGPQRLRAKATTSATGCASSTDATAAGDRRAVGQTVRRRQVRSQPLCSAQDHPRPTATTASRSTVILRQPVSPQPHPRHPMGQAQQTSCWLHPHLQIMGESIDPDAFKGQLQRVRTPQRRPPQPHRASPRASARPPALAQRSTNAHPNCSQPNDDERARTRAEKQQPLGQTHQTSRMTKARKRLELII